jgi:DNA-binding transcriptional regulator YiaG
LKGTLWRIQPTARPQAQVAATFRATEIIVPNLQAVLREEIQRLARREVRSELQATKKAVSQYRRDIAQLKRTFADFDRRLQYLESCEAERLKAGPPAKEPPEGTRFSPTALRNRRERLDLSREDFADLAGVSASTVYNWESERTKPSGEHLAALVALRNIGKREAQRRLELLASSG